MQTSLLRITFAAVLLACAQSALGCSPSGSDLFEPSDDMATHHSDPATGWAAHPVAPEVVSAKVSRGTGSDGVSCADAGNLRVTLRLPKSTPFQFDEIGFYFRVVSGENILAGHALPFRASMMGKRTGSFTFYWLDGAPSQQEPLDLVIEVFAVTHWLEIGPPTRFAIHADVGR